MSANGHDPNTAKMVDLLGQLVAEGRETRAGLEKVVAAVRTLHDEVKGLRTDVTGLKEDMAAVKEDVAELRADVASIKGELSGLRVEIRADLADHEERIGNLERGAA